MRMGEIHTCFWLLLLLLKVSISMKGVIDFVVIDVTEITFDSLELEVDALALHCIYLLSMFGPIWLRQI